MRRAPRTAVAWDCATGNGQAAIGLADHFDHVVATDASEAQIASAIPHDRVTYRVARAEASGLEPASVDLVTVAQALHWLDRDAFYREVRRVLVRGGVIAVWCYPLIEIGRSIDALVRRFHEQTLGAYWSPERRLVDERYRTIEFPFPEFSLPPLVIEQELTLDQVGAYLRTWSAVQRYAREVGVDPVAPLIGEIAPLWGEPERTRRVRWPLAIRAGRRGE